MKLLERAIVPITTVVVALLIRCFLYATAMTYATWDFAKFRKRGRLSVLLSAALLALFFLCGAVSAQNFFVFQPIAARQNPRDFSELLKNVNQLSPEIKKGLNDALREYQTQPSMATVIGVLKYYMSGFYPMTVEQRGAILASDPELFLSVDIAKYELVMQVNKAIGAKTSRQVGSSALRMKEILDWVSAERPADRTPGLHPEVQFSSDLDVTNMTGSTKPLADEEVNGSRAKAKMVEITRGYGNEWEPEAGVVEWLSPTEAYAVFTAKFGPPPDYLLALTASNPEKYNDAFGVYMLDVWGSGKGVITRDVNHPEQSTVLIKDLYGEPHLPPASSKFAYIADNMRQIYVVHDGRFLSECKYLARMIDGWTRVHGGAGLPEGWQQIYDLAQGIYENAGAVEGASDFQARIEGIIKNVVVTTHNYQMDRIADELIKDYNKLKDKAPDQLTGADFENPQLIEELNGLVVAYANLPDDVNGNNVREELLRQFQQRIQKGEASEQALEVFKSHVFKYIMSVVQERTAAEISNIEAFSTIRKEVSEKLSESLKAVDLDRFLEQVAKGEFTTTYWKLDGLRVVKESAQVDPDAAMRHMKLIRALSEAFFEGNKEYAVRVHEYFESKEGLSTRVAIEMLQKLWKVFDSSGAKPVETSYVDEHGNRISGVVLPTGLSLGIRLFGLAVKTGEWGGHIKNGADLYKNLHKWLYESGASSDLEIGQAQAALLINTINFSNLVASTTWREKWKLPMSNVIASSTAGVLWGNAGAIGFDPDANNELAYAALKDLAVKFEPHLAAVILLIDLGRWGYKEWSLSSEKNLIIDAMMQNGIWEPANVKEMGDPNKYKEGELPKLKGIRAQENDPTVWAPEHIARYEFSKMTLIQSKTEINPRETLLDIAYEGNYIESDPVISTSVDAINELSGTWKERFFSSSLYQFSLLPPSSRRWDKDAEYSLGITINRSDDDKSTPLTADQITVSDEHSQDLSGPQLRLMGYLMGDFWIKRQKILEEALLPALIKEASRRWLEKLKADQIELGNTNFVQEINDVMRHVKDVDRKMWARVARAAFPSAYPQPGSPYDPDRDGPDRGDGAPIRDAFKNDGKVADLVKTLQDYQNFLDSGKDSYPQPNFMPQGPGAMPLSFGRTDIIKDGKDKLKQLQDLAYKWQDAYDQVHSVLDSGENLVKEGKLDLRPLYVTFSPGSWSLSELTNAAGGDLSTARSWLDGYQLARKKVLQDIADRAKDAPPSSMLGGLYQEIASFLNTMVNNIDTKQTYSPAHPLWPKLIRLRYEINTIDALLNYTEPINPRDFADALASMTIKEDQHFISSADDTFTDPASRERFLRDIRFLMEQEYNRLLDNLMNQFEIEIAVDPNKPYIGQEANATGKVKLNPDYPSPKLGANGFPDYVARFRWTISDKSSGAEVVGGVETTDPKYAARITRTGDYIVKVAALDSGGNVVAKGQYDGLAAQSLLVWGNIGAQSGDYDGEPFTISVGDLTENTDKLGAFSLELKQYDEQAWDNTQAQASVVVDGKTYRSNFSGIEKIDPSTGIIKIKDDLMVPLPTKVAVSVNVVDKSGQGVNGVDSTIRLNGADAAQGTPATLRLMVGDSVSASVTHQGLGLTASSAVVSYDPSQGHAVQLKVELPMWDTGHLQVSGQFIPAASINPKPQLSGGNVNANIGNTSVGDQGVFALTNDRPLDWATAQFEATATVTDANGRRYLPKAGKIAKQIYGDNSRLDLGQIEVARLGLTLKPIQVQLFDYTGRAITPDAGSSQVLINGVAAANQGGTFVGEYTFTDDDEKIIIEGDFTMPNAGDSVAQVTISARDFGGIGAPSPQAPPAYSLKLQFYLPGSLRVTGRTRIDGVPSDRTAPGFVEIVDAGHGVDTSPVSNMPFDFAFGQPVHLNENITIQATAQDGNLTYQGSIAARAPNGDTSLDVGEIVLSSVTAILGGSDNALGTDVPDALDPSKPTIPGGGSISLASNVPDALDPSKPAVPSGGTDMTLASNVPDALDPNKPGLPTSNIPGSAANQPTTNIPDVLNPGAPPVATIPPAAYPGSSAVAVNPPSGAATSAQNPSGDNNTAQPQAGDGSTNWGQALEGIGQVLQGLAGAIAGMNPPGGTINNPYPPPNQQMPAANQQRPPANNPPSQPAASSDLCSFFPPGFKDFERQSSPPMIASCQAEWTIDGTRDYSTQLTLALWDSVNSAQQAVNSAPSLWLGAGGAQPHSTSAFGNSGLELLGSRGIYVFAFRRDCFTAYTETVVMRFLSAGENVNPQPVQNLALQIDQKLKALHPFPHSIKGGVCK